MTYAGPDPQAAVSDDDLSLMVRIRHFERQVLELFSRGLIGGTTHSCLGQEHVPVVLAPLLEAEDMVFSNHRGHGHYLARYDDPEGLFAEITGREGAVCAGMGGSQHIYRPGFLSTGVQGQLLPVAAGVALDLSRSSSGSLALAYIGDGTWGQGVVYETLNLAVLWRAPLVIVVENNGIAQSTPTSAQMAGTISARCAAFGVAYTRVGGTDVAQIRRTLAAPLLNVRTGGGPLVVEVETVRLGPHSKGDDTRDAAELARVASLDWYRHYEQAFPDRMRVIDERERSRIAAVVSDVLARPRIEASGA